MGNRIAAGPVLPTPAEQYWNDLASAPSLPLWRGQPVALRVQKPGRGSSGDGWVTVGKLTTFVGDTEPILAVAWKTQQGTRRKVSVPAVVVAFAEAAGARFLFLADLNRALLARMPLAQVRRGILQADGEFYIDLADLDSVPFRKWHYAEATLDLDEPAPLGGKAKAVQEMPPQAGLPGFEGLLR